MDTTTTPDGGRLYKDADLIDYHRPTATKDESGGWNGQFPAIKNEPDRGRLIIQSRKREIAVRYPDARHTLLIEVLMTMEFGMDNAAMDLILNYIGRLRAGKAPETFGYSVTSSTPPKYHWTTVSSNAPKVFLVLPFVI